MGNKNKDKDSTILSSLINLYKDDNVLISGKNELEIFSNFMTNTDKSKADNWIKELFTISTAKSVENSKKYRDLGNNTFKARKYIKARKYYSKGVILAPVDSEEYYLALGNRSAVLLIQKKYKECVADIQRCLAANYPENLKYKLYIRLANCYLELKATEKIPDLIEKLLDFTENDNVDIAEDKRNFIKAEVDLINEKLGDIKEGPELLDDSEISIPIFEHGENINFSYASNSISLQFNDEKGRHVIASEDIKLGDIMFIEKPFAFVPILKDENSEFDFFCNHCFKTANAPISCENCLEIYCSETCRDSSYTEYHRFECVASCIDFWPKIGVNFLALRMLFLGVASGFENVFNQDEKMVENFGIKFNYYNCVCSLITNVEKMDKNDLFPHLVSSLAICSYLKEKTNFHCYLKETCSPLSDKTDDQLTTLIGATLFKHILQVISNASIIESVPEEFYQKFNTTEQISENYNYVRGVGLYPSVSMMNHSCDTNIANYFINDYIVVKANRDIKKGTEVYNTYGYDCRKHVTEERQINLKTQYYFECKCAACTFPTRPEIYHEGLACKKCQGCSLCVDDTTYKCTACGHQFDSSGHFSYIKKAEQYYTKYITTRDSDYLIKCLDLREKAFFKYNFTLYTINLDLQTYYGKNGDFGLWWYYTEKSLNMDKHILGENSLRYAMHLRLCFIILLRYLTDMTEESLRVNDINEIKMINYVSSANEMYDSCRRIFKLFYPEERLKYGSFNELLENVYTVATVLLKKNLFPQISASEKKPDEEGDDDKKPQEYVAI